jgi:hypothetical protein
MIVDLADALGVGVTAFRGEKLPMSESRPPAKAKPARNPRAKK